MRFHVIENTGNKYHILDTETDKLCAYSGSASQPPKYVGESKCFYHEWNNYHSAYGFAQKLEYINK